MNRNKFLIAGLFLAIIMLKCNCKTEDLLLLNPNEINPESYFQNEDQVEQAVNAIYAQLQTRGLYQRTMYYSMDNMAYEQLMNPASEYDKLQYSLYSFDADHIGIRDYWKSCYAGINAANFVISNENVINQLNDGILSPAKKQKYMGEARFLRALYYFLLVTRFRDIPLIIENPVSEDGLPKSSSSRVWQLIEEDLDYSATNCLSKNLEEKGRATSGAAWALLGKAHLFQANASNSEADFLSAKNAFLHVLMDPGNYSLENRYLNNFEEETEHGPESVFEVDFNVEAGYSNVWSADDDGSGLNETTFRGREYGLMDWFNVYPTDNLLDEFEPGDPRYRYCFYSVGDIFNNGQDTIKFISLDRRAAWRKYQNYYKKKYEENASGINTKVIRLADVMLMMAEIENELGNLQEAIDYMNQVRNRPDVMMPDFGTPEMNALYPVSDQVEIRRAIEHERKVELCGEQIRFNDLARWHRLEEFITADIIPYLEWWLKDRVTFEADKHYLWPIPQHEIDLNTALTEADQNPGY